MLLCINGYKGKPKTNLLTSIYYHHYKRTMISQCQNTMHCIPNRVKTGQFYSSPSFSNRGHCTRCSLLFDWLQDNAIASTESMTSLTIARIEDLYREKASITSSLTLSQLFLRFLNCDQWFPFPCLVLFRNGQCSSTQRGYCHNMQFSVKTFSPLSF